LIRCWQALDVLSRLCNHHGELFVVVSDLNRIFASS
jgi:hypothetical protein